MSIARIPPSPPKPPGAPYARLASGEAGEAPGPADTPTGPAWSPEMELGAWRQDPFFAEYFRRIDPRIADSFTAEQRAALKLMFAGRAPGRHLIDVRRSLPWFGKRMYLVLLFGRERRTTERLRREGAISRTADALTYAVVLAILLTPYLAGLYLAKSWLGIDLFPDGGLHALYETLTREIGMLFGG
jgi:hypothetical protein